MSQWFDPEPTFKGLAFAKELVRRGHHVEVLTGFPNYPGGKIYPGYRLRFWQRESMDGISVLRVPLFPSHNRSVAGRIFNYCSFAVSASIGCLFLRRPDVIYAYHPPATIGVPALMASWLRRAPLVYDVQDLWPDTVAATGMVRNRLALRLLSKWCGLVYSRADRLVVLSPGFKLALAHRGVPNEKIEVIYNWCDEKAIGTGHNIHAAGDETAFNVLFAGTMGMAQALDSVLEAARICADSLPRARFIFVGGGIDRDRLECKSREMALTNVQFLPWVPMHEIGHVLSTADVLLVHLKHDPLFEITIPSKTQAYLAVGKPVLMAVDGDAADLIRRSGGGITCKPEDPQAMADVVRELASASRERLSEMATSGRSFYVRELSLRVGTDRFEHLFSSLVR